MVNPVPIRRKPEFLSPPTTTTLWDEIWKSVHGTRELTGVWFQQDKKAYFEKSNPKYFGVLIASFHPKPYNNSQPWPQYWHVACSISRAADVGHDEVTHSLMTSETGSCGSFRSKRSEYLQRLRSFCNYGTGQSTGRTSHLVEGGAVIPGY